ncbi:MAG: hypothetical protein IPL99_04295 [Candidatus Competibacteraceae bacterium]|nr:hypothetical protein [Candidatus Competibacteraceae bacterium]
MTRNYELDKRVSHTRNTPGRIVRVSTAGGGGRPGDG